MRRLESQDLSRIREVQNELRTLVDGAPPALDALIPALRDLMNVDRLMAYVLAPRGEGLKLEYAIAHGLPSDAIATFDDWLRDKTVGWGAFNPLCPEPDQRNVVQHFDPRGIQRGLGSTPIMRELLPRIGLGDCERIRVVVCDGPSMLAWIGAFQNDPFDKRQIGIIEELVPSIQRRLKIERLVANADLHQVITNAAFDAIPAATFLVGEGGEVHHANAAAQLLLDRDAAVRASLRGVVRGEPGDYEAMKLTSNGMSPRFLVTHRPSPDAQAEARAVAAATRWGLTRRQREVLALLVRGLSNRTIAGTLGMAEKTVEVHLTAMFEKAQVVSRAALVAKVWSAPHDAMGGVIGGALFDLDGTLVRSSIDFAGMKAAVRAIAARRGVDPAALVARDVLGLIDEAARAIDARDAFIAECEAAIIAFELEALAGAAAFEGAIDTLAWLIDRGVRVGIVTRNSRPAVTRILAAIPLPHHALVTRHEAPRPKPDPSHLLHALALLGVAASDAIMVGDHAMDVAGGRAARMRAIGIAHDGAITAFDGTGADHVVTSFAELRGWIEALQKA